MKRGEVRWIDLKPTVGREQTGHRPALIINTEADIAARQLAVIMPLTSSSWRKPPHAIELSNVGKRRSFALPGQIRTVDAKRLGVVLATVGERDIDRCLDALLTICGKIPPMRFEAENDA